MSGVICDPPAIQLLWVVAHRLSALLVFWAVRCIFLLTETKVDVIL